PTSTSGRREGEVGREQQVLLAPGAGDPAALRLRGAGGVGGSIHPTLTTHSAAHLAPGVSRETSATLLRPKLAVGPPSTALLPARREPALDPARTRAGHALQTDHATHRPGVLHTARSRPSSSLACAVARSGRESAAIRDAARPACAPWPRS